MGLAAFSSLELNADLCVDYEARPLYEANGDDPLMKK